VFVKNPRKLNELIAKNGAYLKPEPPFRRPIILDIYSAMAMNSEVFPPFQMGGCFQDLKGWIFSQAAAIAMAKP